MLCFFWCAGFCRADQLTPDQARQVLLPYVQAPDVSLTAIPATDVNQEGRIEYQFHGDGGTTGSNAGGNYNIDAVTGEKSVTFSGLSEADGNAQTPSSHLTEAQLQQAAANYVAQHFPNYHVGMFSIGAGPIDATFDADEYYVHFNYAVASGADVPISSLVIVEEDTGKIKFYSELNLPLVVSTTPAITSSQAIQLGQNWIAQNISADQTLSQLNTNIGPQSPISLKILVDALLNQTLIYDISYNAIALVIDAQSGNVIATEPYASISSKARSGPKAAKQSREKFWDMKVQSGNGTLVDKFTHAIIFTLSQMFVWEGYLKLGNIRLIRHDKELVLVRGDKKVHLEFSKAASTNNRTAWQRGKSIYVPLAAIQVLSDRFVERPETQDIVIKLQPPQQIKTGL